ncbi:helix-turn-helix domain-containing protein [Metabacillus dongyingensis]|jgi:DNA-binding HxlR family transcriptional regulator|uniref:winged helix-turn-helix transcriptional regulator n=1 Tax=Metabacillus dongyingensis TaxID=2874282 RepID=UPI003B8DF45F
MESNLCPKMEKAFGFLGKRWTGLIINVLLDGPKRFKDLTDTIPSISQKMLVERLKELESAGIVQRVVIPDTPVKVTYQLTEMGRSLEKVMKEVKEWADRYCFEEDKKE